jgi:selenocysteine lyase/cysteine desulfurase
VPNYGLILMVDAAQYLGVLPMDIGRVPVDILVSSGHKWLNAGIGGIRFSCHYFNIADEVEAVLDVLRSARAALSLDAS